MQRGLFLPLLFALAPAIGVAEPAKLTFRDDFQKDTRPQYKINGPVDWQPGKLTLGPGASVGREWKTGPSAELTLDLAFAPLAKDGDTAEVRMAFIVDGVAEAAVVWTRHRQAGKTKGKVRIAQRAGLWPFDKIVREFSFPSDVSAGTWQCHYHYGMLIVSANGKEVAVGYVEFRTLPLSGWRLETRGSAAVCQTVATTAFPSRIAFQSQDAQALEAQRLTAQGFTLLEAGKPRDALPLFERSGVLWEKVFGSSHPEYATVLGNSAYLYMSIGEYTKAEPFCRQAIAVHKATLGVRHPEYAKSLNMLGGIYVVTGNYYKAEPIIRQVLVIQNAVLGEQHPDYATSLNNFAQLYREMGEYAKAEPLHRQAAEIRKATIGERHPDYASSLDGLARVHWKTGNYAKAESLLRQVVDIKRPQGERHPDFATSLNNLADLYYSTREYAKAEPLYRQASVIWKDSLGEHHSHYALSLSKLANLCYSAGNYAQAESLERQTLTIQKEVLGERHPDYAKSLLNLAATYHMQGEHSKAEPLCRQAFDIYVHLAEQTVPALAEAAALAFLTVNPSRADALLALLGRRQSPNEAIDAYGAAWTAKALATRLLAERRALFADRSGRVEEERLAAELRDVRSQLAQLTLATPGPKQGKQRHERLAALTTRKEELEGQLAVVSADYRHSQTIRRAFPSDLAARLPSGTAIVDFLKTQELILPRTKGGPPEWIWRYEAFVVTASGAASARRDERGRLVGPTPHRSPNIVWVRLPAGPIEAAMAAWRAEFVGAGERGLVGQAQAAKQSAAESPAEVLRRELWDKLEPHLAGCTTIVLLPDAELTRLPWAAMPGRKPGTHLADDYALATAGYGQQVFDLLTAPPIQTGGGLVVGGVDYEASASPPAALAATSRSPAIGSDRPRWPLLAGALTEATAITTLWPQKDEIARLTGPAATEATLRDLLPKARFAHLATHGFFADK